MNILLLFPDQLRADFLSCYGARFIATPHIDRLCNGGTRYARAIAPAPLCVAARASLLTGVNAIKHGAIDNYSWLRPDHSTCGLPTLPEVLSDAGYHTESIGKMHFYPWDAREGFAHRVISEDKRHIFVCDDYADYLAQNGLRKFHGNEHDGYFENKGTIISKIPAEYKVDKWVADRTIHFLENYRDAKPFFAMIGFPGPHDPYDPPIEFANRFDPAQMPASIPATPASELFREYVIASHKRQWNQVDYTDFRESHKQKIRAHYAALVAQIDHHIGRILDALARAGRDQDTAIIFASDHGDLLGDFNLISKHVFFEPAAHVPLIVRLPNASASHVIAHTVSLTDLHATILALAGRTSRRDNDSIPLGIETRARDYLFGATELGFVIRTDEWKLCRYKNGLTALFDLKNDPTEQNNRAYDAASIGVLKGLDAILQKEITESILFGQSDKFVEESRYQGRGEFGARGWARRYPASIAEKN